MIKLEWNDATAYPGFPNGKHHSGFETVRWLSPGEESFPSPLPPLDQFKALLGDAYAHVMQMPHLGLSDWAQVDFEAWGDGTTLYALAWAQYLKQRQPKLKLTHWYPGMVWGDQDALRSDSYTLQQGLQQQVAYVASRPGTAELAKVLDAIVVSAYARENYQPSFGVGVRRQVELARAYWKKPVLVQISTFSEVMTIVDGVTKNWPLPDATVDDMLVTVKSGDGGIWWQCDERAY